MCVCVCVCFEIQKGSQWIWHVLAFTFVSAAGESLVTFPQWCICLSQPGRQYFNLRCFSPSSLAAYWKICSTQESGLSPCCLAGGWSVRDSLNVHGSFCVNAVQKELSLSFSDLLRCSSDALILCFEWSGLKPSHEIHSNQEFSPFLTADIK